jgi:hypothetical protein
MSEVSRKQISDGSRYFLTDLCPLTCDLCPLTCDLCPLSSDLCFYEGFKSR